MKLNHEVAPPVFYIEGKNAKSLNQHFTKFHHKTISLVVLPGNKLYEVETYLYKHMQIFLNKKLQLNQF